ETKPSIYHFPNEISSNSKVFFQLMYNDKTSPLYGKAVFKTFKSYFNFHSKNTISQDFDKDGDDDILYFGQIIPGAENENVILFLKTSDNYLIHDLGTTLDTMYQNSSGYYFKTTFYLPINVYLTSMEFFCSNEFTDSVQLKSNELYGLLNAEDSCIHQTNCKLSFSKEKDLYFVPEQNQLSNNNKNNENLIGKIPPNTKLDIFNYIIINGEIWYYTVLSSSLPENLSNQFTQVSHGPILKIRGWVSAD
ncbi:MAG: hypothetical protein IT221_12040, partial [Fluviicola sp.]|nr:hypothetical protein [Fluviicola sp.]